MIVFWGIAAGAFLVLEAITAAMTSIWFCAGALAALIAAACTAPLWLQIVVFVVVSAVCFLLLYPRLKNYLHKTRQPTNADMAIGKICVVTETIDNLAATGTAVIDGKTWTARSADGSVIPAGKQVHVEAMEGVKLLVKTVEEKMEVV